MPVNILKIRQLQLISGTVMACEFREKPEDFDLYSLDDYISLVISFIENINPAIMIDRISGEAPPRMLDDPRSWSLRSNEILKLFGERLEERETWQGRLFRPGS